MSVVVKLCGQKSCSGHFVTKMLILLLGIPYPLIRQMSFIFSLVLFVVIIEDFYCFGFSGCEIASWFPMFFVVSIISDWNDGICRFSIFAFEMFLVGKGRKCPFYVYLSRIASWFCSFQFVRLLPCAHGAPDSTRYRHRMYMFAGRLRCFGSDKKRAWFQNSICKILFRFVLVVNFPHATHSPFFCVR